MVMCDSLDLGKYSVVSLFSGAMGLDIGLDRTKQFKLLAAVEKVPSFCETIRANHKAGRLPEHLVIFERDISALDPAEILESVGLKPGQLDVLVGGPPCQSFSTAGKRGTTQDPRGTLLWHYLRFVKALKPKFFIMENVRGLLSAALRHRPIAERPEKGGRPLDPDELPGSVVRRFAEELRDFEECSYHMDCFEVNAVNYGAPQLRERAIFIGNRYNETVDFPDPTHGLVVSSGKATRSEQPALFESEIESSVSSDLKPWRTLGDALKGLNDPDPVRMEFSPRKLQYLAMVPPGSNWRSLPEEVQRESMGLAWSAKGGRSGWWRRLSMDLPCPTLVTLPNHSSTSLCHPAEVRALTLREYARIQEFPDDWEICGKPTEQFAQIGNAVPVRLGEVAGQVVAQKLNELKANGWQVNPKRPDAYRVVYIQSHVRTRKWFKDGETFVWNDGEDCNGAEHSAPKTMRRSKAIKIKK